MEEKIFAALNVDWQEGRYQIFLVNPTEKSYRQVTAYTGAYFSDDDKVVEQSRFAKSMGELCPYSWVVLEDDTVNQLDFFIWYWLDLLPIDQSLPAETLEFSLPKYKYTSCYENSCQYLSVIEKRCPGIAVQERSSDLGISEQIIKDRQVKRSLFVFDFR